MPPALDGMLETILVVDESEAVLGFVTQILKAENFRVFMCKPD
jgi:hypothetical protein